MRCSLFSNDGVLMSEGACEGTEGAIQMTAQNWHMSPQQGDGPLTLVIEDGQGVAVRVDEIVVTGNETGTDPREMYRLTVLDPA